MPAHLETEWTLIQARGENAIEFLQGQLSCDVLAGGQSDCIEGLVLTPGGDVITSLVCRLAPEGVDLVVRREVAEASLVALRRFLLRTRCTLLDAGSVPGPYATVGDQLRRGEPGPGEFAANVSAHTFGRDFVARHVSFTKGCFTGQELVGRLDARGGNVPFRLARVTGEDLDMMELVVASTGPRGERAIQGLRTVVADRGFVALALVHRSLLGDAQEVTLDGVRVEGLHGETEGAR